MATKSANMERLKNDVASFLGSGSPMLRDMVQNSEIKETYPRLAVRPGLWENELIFEVRFIDGHPISEMKLPGLIGDDDGRNPKVPIA